MKRTSVGAISDAWLHFTVGIKIKSAMVFLWLLLYSIGCVWHVQYDSVSTEEEKLV